MDVAAPPLYGHAVPASDDVSAPPAAASETNVKSFVLEPEHELRVETRPGHAVVVALIAGKAEIFGAELQLGERREVSGGCPFAVFTWTGATVALSAAAATAAGGAAAADGPSPPLETAVSMSYIASHTPMPSYLNAHDALEARRTLAAEAVAASAPPPAAAAAPPASKKKKTTQQQAQPPLPRRKRRRRHPGEGPRAIVVGPTNAGKSTICKILLNYAVRSGWRPTFVDLDVGQGALAPPGCLAAAPVDAPVAADAPMPDAPLAFFFGSASPSDNLPLFRFLVSKMADLLDRRSEIAIGSTSAGTSPSAPGDDDGGQTASRRSKGGVAASGWVVNWPGWCEGDEALGLLEDVVRSLSIDTVLVVGNERLHAVLKERLGGKRVGGGGGGGGGDDDGGDDDFDDDKGDAPSPPPKEIFVANLPRSEGAVVRDVDTRRAARSARVKEYFYGPPAKVGSGSGSHCHQQPLRPAALRLRKEELEILKIGGGASGRPRAPVTALPIGHGAATTTAAAAAAGDASKANGQAAAGANGAPSSAAAAVVLQVERREPGPDLVHSLLALSHPSSSSKSSSKSSSSKSFSSSAPSGAERALSEPVAGFLYVTAVDAHTGAVTVLAPCAGTLPSRVALAGSVKVFLE